MLISIDIEMEYTARAPCDVLVQFEAAQEPTQEVVTEAFTRPCGDGGRTVLGEEGIGHRRWIRIAEGFSCRYRAQVRVTRDVVALEDLAATSLRALPSDVTKFLMPSRYCAPEDFLAFTQEQFSALSGGPAIAAMRNWIAAHFTYDNGASHAGTTATESFMMRAGVCRDYAHILIAMARAVGIPARFVSCYAPDVDPQDFHAVAEVYLEDAWHLVDATGMASAPEIVRIGVGRDAADVSFMTSYGWMELKKQAVAVFRVG